MSAPRTKGWYWPYLLGGLLGLVVVINLVFVYIATNDPSFAVEKDYYRKALAWDRTMAQQGANEALGWRLDLAVAPALGSAAVLAVTLVDRDGAPIDSASVSVEAFHTARAAGILAGTLAETPEHRYETTLPMRRPGLWEFRFRVTRGSDVFTRVLRQDVDL